ncbi:MAG: PglZ domain-containing protein, partial [Anaerolinea sp.]|nr:PglZ domain-containing protein [Anaerolinea sp.]
MKIKTFIQNEIFLPRLKQHGVLVVYDPDLRYREISLGLQNEKIRVIDASESSITSRFSALEVLSEFGQPNPSVEGILVYVPAKAPVTDEEKQRDPFAIYGACGSVFPEGDGDEFLSLCLKARADYATEIRRIFKDNPNPSFAVIDATGGGAGWPNLQALLKVESARDILFALLAPSETQKEALKNQTTWVSEATELFQSTLGLNLKTKIKTWSA